MKWYERPRIIEFIVFFGMLAGLSLSAMLWIGERAYPLTPLLHPAIQLPAPFDTWLVILMVALGFISLTFPKNEKYMLGFLGALGALLFLDQSRWQPWVFIYLFFFIGLYLIRRRPNEARVHSMYDVFRLMLIAVYVWSALQKMNVSFLTQSGPSLLGALPFFGDMLSASVWMILLLPVIEFAIGLGLFFSKTRKSAVILATVFHLGILLAIGPTGLNWNNVVWPWNVVMVLLVFVLFWNAQASIPVQSMVRTKYPFVLAVLLFFFALPALNFSGYWDSYLSFALYSDNVKRGFLIMEPEHLRVFPERVWPIAERQRDGRVKLQQFNWSIELMNVPRYPEERIFRSGLRWACEKTGDDISMEIHGRPHWLTKERRVKRLSCEDL